MMQDKDITKTKLYNILQYVYYFLTTNILFLIMNLIFFIGQLYIPLSISSILLYFLILIPSGPSITALFFTMRKLIIEKNISVARTFFRAYKENFGESMRYWLVQLTIFTVLFVDLLFVLDKGYTLLAIVISLVLIVLVVLTINSFLVLSTFEVSLKNLYIFSFLMIFYNIIKSIGNLSILIGFSAIWYVIPSQATLFIFSVTVYYLVKNNHQTLIAFQKKYSTADEDEHV